MSIGTMPSMTPLIPPIMNVTMKAKENSIAVEYVWILP